jgi:hypothetical protein
MSMTTAAQRQAPSEPEVAEPANAPDTHGIRRIILLDSYLRGSRTQMILDGHTGITGRNGSGKTSLIRLLPLFFGAEPGHLARRDTGSHRESFAGYYLPGDGSYVVFEYATHDGLQMAAFITAGARDSVRPILISGSYDEGLFVGDDGQFLPKDDLTQRVRAAGRAVHRLESMHEYRNIVLGDYRARGARASLYRFNVLYGYPGQNKRRALTEVHHVLTATLDNSVDERLLQMLLLKQATYAADINTDGLLTPPVDTSVLESWVANYRGLRTMRGHRETASEALDAAEHVERLGYEEALLRAAAAVRREDLIESSRQAEQRADELSLEQTGLTTEYKTKDSAHQERASSIATELGSVQTALRALEGTEREYRNNGIGQTLEDAKEVESRKEEAERARAELELLESKTEEIDAKYKAKRESADERLEDRREAAGKVLETSQQDHARQQQDITERQSDEREQLSQEQARLTNEVTQALTAAVSESTRLSTLIANISPPATLTERERACEKLRDDAVTALGKAREALDHATDDHRKLAEDTERCQQDLKRHQASVNQLTEAHKTLSLNLDRQGTLLAFAKEHVPGWQSTIAASLSQGTDLLYDTRLSPRLTDDATQSLFGIHIDTERLDPVDIEKDDREKLGRLANELSEARSSEAGLKTKLRALQAGAEEASKSAKLAGLDHSGAQNRKTAAQSSFEGIREEIRVAVEKLRTECAAELAEAKSALTDAETAQRQRAEESKKAETDQRQRHIKEQKTLANAERAARDQHKQTVGQAKDDHRETLKQLEGLRSSRLTEEGLDPRKIERARSKDNIARIAYQAALEAEGKVASYRAFRKEYDAKYPELKHSTLELSSQSDHERDAWTKVKQQYDTAMARLDKQINSARSDALSDQGKADRLLALLNQEEALGCARDLDDEAIAAYRDLPVKTLIVNHDGVREQGLHYGAQLRKALRLLSSAFASSSSRLIRDYADARNLNQQATTPETPSLLAAAASVRDFFGDEPVRGIGPSGSFPIESHAETYEASVREVPFQLGIKIYIDQLAKLRRAVSTQSSHLTANSARIVGCMDSIHSVAVSADFDYERLAGYQATHAMHAACDKFSREVQVHPDDRLMPDDSLAIAAQAFLDSLSARGRSDVATLADALQLEFKVKLREDGQELTCRKGSSLKSAFSEGVGTLVAVIVLVGFLEGARQGLSIATPWMLDELLRLDEANSRGLLEALRQMRIYLVSTSPDISAELDPLFSRRYALQTLSQNGEVMDTPTFVEIDLERDHFDPFDDAGASPA